MLQVVKKPSYLTGIIHLINEESAKLFVMALINIEILTSRELLYTKSCMRNQLLFCKKDAFQNTDFSRFKCQPKRKKKLTQHICKDFPCFPPRGNG